MQKLKDWEYLLAWMWKSDLLWLFWKVIWQHLLKLRAIALLRINPIEIKALVQYLQEYLLLIQNKSKCLSIRNS